MSVTTEQFRAHVKRTFMSAEVGEVLEPSAYLMLKLVGEVSEFEGAWWEKSQEDVIGEAGDVLWYLVALEQYIDWRRHEGEVQAQRVYMRGRYGRVEDKLAQMRRCVARAAELYAKAARDEGRLIVAGSRYHRECALSLAVAHEYMVILLAQLGVTMERVMIVNVAKLNTRIANGTLKGDSRDE